MTPPRHPPPLRLADDPPPTPRRTTLGELESRVDALDEVVGTTAAKVETLTKDHDAEANETLATVRTLAKSVESLHADVRTLGGSLADIEAQVARRTAVTTSSATGAVVVIVEILRLFWS